MQNNIRQFLQNHPLIPVVNITDLSQVEPICNAILTREIKCIEITLRGEWAIEAIATAKKLFGDTLSIGAGTVVNKQQVTVLSNLGVDFLVSPGYSGELVQSMKDSGLPFIPGVMTPSEIIEGLNTGLNTFKLFPANLAGGISALNAYNAVFPDVMFCPTGGIDEANHLDFLSRPNVISVGGSWLGKK